ncbi:Hypothetical_protein [Hexamita inflata]|uniref:Hypothetical_protein n=1 Tax=Hexamita inflata TaxID=28002 RepID=A0AA86UT49_9EUKA|nr:Hypothetical protein HINF_LOCUS51467 [Hexamita inflata]
MFQIITPQTDFTAIIRYYCLQPVHPEQVVTDIQYIVEQYEQNASNDLLNVINIITSNYPEITSAIVSKCTKLQKLLVQNKFLDCDYIFGLSNATRQQKISLIKKCCSQSIINKLEFFQNLQTELLEVQIESLMNINVEDLNLFGFSYLHSDILKYNQSEILIKKLYELLISADQSEYIKFCAKNYKQFDRNIYQTIYKKNKNIFYQYLADLNEVNVDELLVIYLQTKDQKIKQLINSL